MALKIGLFNQWFSVALLCGVMAGVSGCSAESPPIETISTASLALDRAIEARAIDYAPLELQLAEEKLDRAKQSVDGQEYEQARRMAEQALVDAQLAEAKAQSETARQTLEEVQQTIETLPLELGKEAMVMGE